VDIFALDAKTLGHGGHEPFFGHGGHDVTPEAQMAAMNLLSTGHHVLAISLNTNIDN
jgi:hypothetical protein